MYKWVSESEVSKQLGYKILLAGLSEAGKTAVKRIFFLKQETKDVSSLSATINYERLTIKISNKPVTIVDLGGQKIFLKRFLNNYSPFVFSSVKALIYLIDVANKTTRNNSIQYFASCLEKLQTFSPEAEIFVFLHKNDLVRDSPNYESIHLQLKEQFQLKYTNKLRFFRTTIYRPESVIDSFGRIFELCMPELAKSELVDEMTIGEIEEFAEKYEIPVEREDEIAKVTKKVISPINSSSALSEDPILNKLKFLVSDGMKLPTSSSDNSIPKTTAVYDAAVEEMTSEKSLTPLESSVKDSHPEKLEILATPEKSALSEEDGHINKLISHINRFYGVSVDDATEIVKSGYPNVFEMAVKSGIPIPVVNDVILKYIPYIKSQGLNSDSLTTNRLLELFLAFLSGSVKEDDLERVLVLAIEKPNISIEEIISKHLVQQVKIAEPKFKEKKEEPYEYINVSIPIETSSVDNIISIPNTKSLGFKIELVENNASLMFYAEEQFVGKTTVPLSITIEEIMYLLAYEMNLQTLGFLEKGTHPINFTARIIYEALKTLRPKKAIEVAQLPQNKVEFIIPLEIKLEEDYLLIPGSEGLAFKVEKKSEGFLLGFTQRGFPIVQINIQKSISIQELITIMVMKFQLPFESECVAYSTARIIRSILDIYIEEKPSLALETIITSPTEKIDKTSEELKNLLDLLQKD